MSGSHEVRTHTRRLPSGRTVTVRQHTRADDGTTAPVDAPLDEKDQDRRDRLERRVLLERQRQAKAQRTGKPAARVPGQRARRKPKAVTRAKRHAKKARRLWRRHKAKAIGYAFLALAGITAYGIGRGSSRAWKAARRLRRKRK